MPATAGRVRMPANNRVHSSAALQTHGIWQSAIGYDPYAPTRNNNSKPESDNNAYDSFQGLLALARVTSANPAETRGACKKCGRIGHLTYQCRNFLTLTKIAADDDVVNKHPTATKHQQQNYAAAPRIEEEECDDEDDDESSDSDSSIDPEIEKIIAERFGKKMSKKVRSLNAKRSTLSDDDGEERGKKRRHGRRRRNRHGHHRRRRDSDSDSDSDSDLDSYSNSDRDRKRRRQRRRRERDSDSGSDRKERRKHRERKSVLSSESESTGSSSSDEDDGRRAKNDKKRRSRG